MFVRRPCRHPLHTNEVTTVSRTACALDSFARSDLAAGRDCPRVTVGLTSTSHSVIAAIVTVIVMLGSTHLCFEFLQLLPLLLAQLFLLLWLPSIPILLLRLLSCVTVIVQTCCSDSAAGCSSLQHTPHQVPTTERSSPGCKPPQCH